MSKFNPDHIRILNMLNAKYFIFPLQGGGEELDSLAVVDLRKTAVVNLQFAEQVKAPSQASVSDSTRSITFKHYEPNELIYEVTSQAGGTVVFSEIYYPEWQAFVDDEEDPV